VNGGMMITVVKVPEHSAASHVRYQ
jgi:hypothetical protein